MENMFSVHTSSILHGALVGSAKAVLVHSGPTIKHLTCCFQPNSQCEISKAVCPWAGL
jgi:hypothetical protein